VNNYFKNEAFQIKIEEQATDENLQSELTVASSDIKVDICDLMKDKQPKYSLFPLACGIAIAAEPKGHVG
jgi:hypothetical protein